MMTCSGSIKAFRSSDIPIKHGMAEGNAFRVIALVTSSRIYASNTVRMTVFGKWGVNTVSLW